MPSAHEILDGLTTIANHERSIAIAWHAVVGGFVVGLVRGWRPPKRVMGIIIALSLASVSAVGWTFANPFNGVIFGFLSLTLAVVAIRLPVEPIRIGSPRLVTCGAVLVGFGWIYPHFLNADAWESYLYASPLGLIPCPTLAAATGLTLIAGTFGSRAWLAVLASAGILYGVVGVFLLGVVMDLVLLAGALGVAAIVARDHAAAHRLRAVRH